MYRFQGKHATKKSSIQSYLQKIHSQSHFSSIFHPARAAWRCPARAPPAPRCVPRCRAHPSCGIAVRTPRAPLRAHRPCPVAVGRDVPIAPPRLIARGGSPPRCAAWQVAHAGSFAGASPCAPHSRAGRGVRSPTRGTAAGPLPPPPPPAVAHRRAPLWVQKIRIS